MNHQMTDNEFRRLLGEEHQEFSDEEIECSKKQLYELAYTLMEIWKENELRETIKN